ncbi:MAG: RAMP superfamily CRISPR-associated protein [Bacteroidota bacterium]
MNNFDFFSVYNSDEKSSDVKKQMKDFFNDQNGITKKTKQLDSIKKILTYPPSWKPCNLDNLPPYSMYLQFTFTLAKPYISKDDDSIYFTDNPIKKEKVFRVPYIASSSWKGNMRWVASKDAQSQDKDIIVTRLFGNNKEIKNDFRRGRLHFYPTFFDTIGIEMINPHDREKGIGTIPVTIESVPAGTIGAFSLLYVPFDIIDQEYSAIKAEATEDIKLIFSALENMFLTYGFSAKKSSGYGIIADELTDCHVNIKGETTLSKPAKTFKELSNYISEIRKQL